MDKESTTIKESLGKAIEVVDKEIKSDIKINKEQTDEVIKRTRAEVKTTNSYLLTNKKAISQGHSRTNQIILTQEVTSQKLQAETERSTSMTMALIAKANDINTSLISSVKRIDEQVAEVNATVSKAQNRFNTKMIEIRESLTQFRREADLSHIAIREQTDTALTSIEEATRASLLLVHSESNRTNERIDRLEKRLVPDFMVGTFLKDCPAGWTALDGHEIPDDESFSVLYLESGSYPDLRGRYMMMKDDSTELLQKLRNTTAVNGLTGTTSSKIVWLESRQMYPLDGDGHGIRRWWTKQDNRSVRFHGDPKTRPDTIVVNKCIKLKPKEN